MKPKLKLYIWKDFSPDYSGGLAIAIAHTGGDARLLVEKERGYEVYNWGKLEIRPLTLRVARSVSGGG